MAHPRTRAERRAALDRWKQRVRAYYGGYAASDARLTGRLASARTPCSCWMHGSPRHKSKDRLTVQERRAA